MARPKKTTRTETVQKAGTLAWLEQIYLRDGRKAAADAFSKTRYDAPSQIFEVHGPHDGKKVLRTDSVEADRIHYLDFSPQPSIEHRYSILKVDVEPEGTKDTFMYHAGEEVLFPVNGEGQEDRAVYYELHNPLFSAEQREVYVKHGEIIWINSSIPHRNKVVGKPKGAIKVWMVMRDIRETAAAISLPLPRSGIQAHTDPRRVTEEDLNIPGRFALIAWGLAEQLELQRQTNGLRISDVATACAIDPSHLSRVENGNANVSLESLNALAKYLSLNLKELIAPVLEPPRKCKFPTIGKKFEKTDLGLNPTSLDVSCWSIPRSFNIDANQLGETPPTSWILSKGRVVLDYEDNGKMTGYLLDEGGVAHFMPNVLKSIQALEPSQLVGVRYQTS
jgi:transcriptional regulator with XRE-family HTH domain